MTGPPKTATTVSVPQVNPIQIGNVTVDPPILQAPMAGFTNYAFRQIVREYGGAELIATEMIKASSFVCLLYTSPSPRD